MENSIAVAPDDEDNKAIVDRLSEKVSLADAATLDDTDDGDQLPEGKLAPAAVNGNDDAHSETDEDDDTPSTRRGKSQTPKVGTRETVDRASLTWCATTKRHFSHMH